MEEIEIVTLKPDKWQDYKNLRLKYTKEDPEATWPTYEATLKIPDKEWRHTLEIAGKGNNNWTFFAKINGELVGMVSGRITIPKGLGDTIKIKGMYVIKEVRGQGIGKKLLEYLLNEIKKHSQFKVVRLGVFTSQEVAINLYKSLDFEIKDKVTEYFPDGIIHETFVMERDLI